MFKFSALLITIVINISFSQSRTETEIFSAINRFQLKRAQQLLNSTPNDQFITKLFKWKLNNLVFGDLENFPKRLESYNSVFEEAVFELYRGDFLSETGVDQVLCYNHYLIAGDLAKKINNAELNCEALKRQISIVNQDENNIDLLKELLAEYRSNVYNEIERRWFNIYDLRSRSLIDSLSYIEEFKRGLNEAKVFNDSILMALYYKLLGVKYDVYAEQLMASGYLKPYEQSIKSYNQAIAIYDKTPFYFSEIKKVGVILNKGINYHFQNKLDSAHHYYRISYGIISEHDIDHKLLFHLWSARTLEKEKKFKEANYHRVKESEYRKLAKSKKATLDIAQINAKYQTAEKEKQLLEEQQKLRTNRNWLIAATLALILGTGIAVLLQKNTSKKRQLAEQEALLKQQRVENLLKEQELVSIDAMIAGQEKERQKVAGELHDDLGSLMATIKLHFDNAKVNKKDPALQNAQKLLEEAYQKIRGMAHNKHSGVMSDQGLLPAIRKMAQTITDTDALEVTVEDFGLGERMENSLELSIFRMVQELVANAIKHAEASAVNIQLTQHEDNLNIIVEDNGKGFDGSKLGQSQSGMGLTTIEKRVEHLEGNFMVDSILGKGTSILIDIPV